ncbi:unnamed protein product [Lathyrus oleraceus]
MKKKTKASEVGGCNYTSGNISVAKVARRMSDKLGRTPLLTVIHLEICIKRNGEFVDDRSRNTKDILLILMWTFRLVMMLYVGRGKMGVYDAGGYTKTIKQCDRSFRMRLADGDGSLRPPILTTNMLETMRNLVHTEVACKTTTRNAEME